MIVITNYNYDRYVADLTANELDVFQRAIGKFEKCEIDFKNHELVIDVNKEAKLQLTLEVHPTVKFKDQLELQNDE